MEEQLYRDILARPDLDEPRVAYAAWAKHHGDPRGELIELQLAIARKLRAHAGPSAYVAEYRRVQALIEIHGALWQRPVADLLLHHVLERAVFRRGFIEDVTLDAGTFVARATELYALVPIRHLGLTGIAAHPQALSQLGRIVSLDASGQELDDPAIEVLAASPASARLRWLDIAVNRITEHGLELICASPHLRGLRYINCRGNRFDNPIEQFGAEGEAIISTEQTELGRELERRHGRLEWLHAPSQFGDQYPPDPEATVDP
jgi:uncharacterized protein (TIGR02996 family)